MSDATNDTTRTDGQCAHGKTNCRACGPEMDVLARIEAAFQHVFDLCAKRKTWRMSIPVESTDSDELIARALKCSRDEIVALRADLDRLAGPVCDDSSCKRRAIEHSLAQFTVPHFSGHDPSPSVEAWLRARSTR